MFNPGRSAFNVEGSAFRSAFNPAKSPNSPKIPPSPRVETNMDKVLSKIAQKKADTFDLQAKEILKTIDATDEKQVANLLETLGNSFVGDAVRKLTSMNFRFPRF